LQKFKRIGTGTLLAIEKVGDAVEKIGDWKKLRFWYKTSHFEILSVHDLLQHLATAGELTQQE